MTERSVTHATFVVERTYAASPARVFAAWAEPTTKRRWFGGDQPPTEFDLDFRVGGREINRGVGPDGRTYTYEARYQDIVPDPDGPVTSEAVEELEHVGDDVLERVILVPRVDAGPAVAAHVGRDRPKTEMGETRQLVTPAD